MHKTLPIILISLTFGGFLFSNAAQAAIQNAMPHIYYSNQGTAPFSTAVKIGNTLYISGMTGFDSATNKLADSPSLEAKLIMEQMKAALAKAGMTMNDVVRLDVYTTNLDLYDEFNSVEKRYFSAGKYPTRTMLGIDKLLDGAHFEVNAIAIKQ